MIHLSGDNKDLPKKYARIDILVMWLECQASIKLNPRIKLDIDNKILKESKFKLWHDYSLSPAEIYPYTEELKKRLFDYGIKNKCEMLTWENIFDGRIEFMFLCRGADRKPENLFKVWKN